MQVGDSLVVRDRAWYDVSRNYYGNIIGPDMDFTSGMAEWCGRVVIIAGISNSGHLYLVEDPLQRPWAAWMFEDTIASSTAVTETRPIKKVKHCADGKCDIS